MNESDANDKIDKRNLKMLRKVLRITVINILLFIVMLGLALGLFEGWLAYRDTSNNAGVIKTLKEDRVNGWESMPEMTQIGKDGASKIIFVGDSFTQGARWTGDTINNLTNSGHSVSGYSLGVAGYGTIQELNKLSKNIGNLSPKVVVLLFFAWNDLRDNFPYPGIYYNVQTRSRPFYDFSKTPPSVSPPVMWPHWVLKSRLYQQYIFPLITRSDEKILGTLSFDEIAQQKISVFASYGDTRSWDPFYRTNKQNSVYVSQTWLATKYALKDLKDIVETKYHAKLLVVGIDNAFTVDEDVLDEYVKDRVNFDSGLPLQRLGDTLAELNISYINALPALRELRAGLGRKVYNGPKGNLSGHFERESENLVGRLVAEKVRPWL